jgi:phosphoserine phosphatase RsbU/P
MAVAQHEPHMMRCLEVWGGNRAVDNGVVMAGLDAWLYSRPFKDQAAGGDIHYVSSCAAGMVTRVLVADVSGHGEEVAEAAGKLRGLMRRYVNFVDQTKFVQGLNAEFGAVAEAGGFATAIAATYLAATDEFTLCNAGHPRPLWYQAKTGAWKLMSEQNRGNVPLGIGESECYDQVKLKLATGDVVVLYTDSLIEVKGPDGKMLGQDGLLKLVQGLDPSDPGTFMRALLESLERQGEGGAGGDDLTVLILRPNGLKPRVSKLVMLKAMGKMAAAAVGGLFGGEEFPFEAPRVMTRMRALFAGGRGR